MSALWRVNLMLALNRSLFNREYILMNVLKALASIISMCNFHALYGISLYSLRTDHAANTAPIVVEACLPRRYIATVAERTTYKASHMIAISSVHWRADCCLATSYKHLSYCWVRLHEVFISPLPSYTRYNMYKIFESIWVIYIKSCFIYIYKIFNVSNILNVSGGQK
jgi:hypothetical protein